MTLKVVCLSLLTVASMTIFARGQGQKPGVNCNDPNVICPPSTSPTRRPPKKQATKQLLGIQWQIVAIDKKGIESPIDPNTADWSNVEGARILVQVNQPGYLYIVSQTIEKNNDLSRPQVVFNGVVAKDNVIDLPTENQPRGKYNGKYWWKIAGSSSRPIVAVFFCRDRLDELDKGTSQSRDRDLGVDYKTFLSLIQNTAAPRRRTLPLATQTPPKPLGYRNSLTPATPALGITGPFVTISSSPNRNEDEVLAEIIEIKRR